MLAGGELRKLFRNLPLRGAPNKIPASIVVDVADMEQGDSVKVKDIPLEEGVAIAMDAERNLVQVVTSRHRKEVDEDAEGGAPAAEGAAPAAEGGGEG